MRRVATVSLLLVAIGTSDAMGCTLASMSPREQVHRAKLAVYVSVSSVRTLGETRPGVTVWEARVRRLKTFKGRPPRVFRVRSDTEESTCGLPMFHVGERMGLLLGARRPPFSIGLGSTISLAGLRQARK